MKQNRIPYVLCLLLVCASPLAGQSLEPELEKVGKGVERYFQQKRPGWVHDSVPPAMPPGSRPSPTVAIHLWSSEKCLTAEVIIDGVNSGKQPVPCRVKLAIYQAPSASEAHTGLSNFVLGERSATPITVGDKGYVWHGSKLVFIKGKFTFWLSGGLDVRVGDFSYNGEFMEKLAKEIADAVPAT